MDQWRIGQILKGQRTDSGARASPGEVLYVHQHCILLHVQLIPH